MHVLAPFAALATALGGGDDGARIAEVARRAAGFGWSGSAHVAREGEVLFAGGAGMADRARGVANTADTLFSIGSMTKQFTAVAVLRLEEDGELALEDALGKHFPDAPEDKRAITLRQLLDHTSGLPVAWFDQFDPTPAVTRDELVARVLALPLEAPPGTRFAYSNAAYQLLAALVELRAGEDYWSVVRERLLDPAGMRAARTPREVGPADALALGYEGPRVAAGLAEARGSTWLPAGDSGLLCSANDLARWYAALGAGELLSPAAMERMLSAGKESYGCGVWVRRSKRGTRVVMHGGDMWGYGAEALWYVDEDALVIATSNDRPNYTQHYRALTQGSVPEIVFGLPESAPLPEFGDVPAEALAALAGTYSIPSGGSLVLAWRDGRLSLHADGQDAVDSLASQRETPERLAQLRADALAVVDGFYAGKRERLDALLAPGVFDGDPRRVERGLADLAARLGAFRSARVVGTAQGFYDPRSTTWLELAFERGRERLQLTWQDGALWWSDTHVLGPAHWNLQAASQDELVGFDLATKRELRLAVREGGRALAVAGDGGREFRRRAP